MKKIVIKCDTKDSLPLEELKEFQGNLKSITPEELNKLKQSITKHGFSFPVFVWENNLLDGHQRVKALGELKDEGYTIDSIPIVKIKALDAHDAAEKLLLINSRYATIFQDGFEDFIDTFSIDIDDIDALINIPDIDLLHHGETDYDAEWDGMPEFEQPDAGPVRTILVHFMDEKDVKKFADLIKQNITDKTKFVYFPKVENFDAENHRYES